MCTDGACISILAKTLCTEEEKLSILRSLLLLGKCYCESPSLLIRVPTYAEIFPFSRYPVWLQLFGLMA